MTITVGLSAAMPNTLTFVWSVLVTWPRKNSRRPGAGPVS